MCFFTKKEEINSSDNEDIIDEDNMNKYNIIKELHANSSNYLIHDNGGRPFCVYISPENKVYIYKIYKNCKLTETNCDELYIYTELITSFEAIEIFIGKSLKNEITKFSDGYGKDFDGNSILLYLGDYKYVFIGKEIYSFTVQENIKIVKFMSPIGNSNVPYPYAIDNENNYYFLIAYSTLKVLDKTKEDDPYNYYYDMLGRIRESENIECMYIKDEEYIFTSELNPEKDYNSITNRIGNPIYIKKLNENKKIISKNEYIDLLTKYNNKIGLKSIENITIIHERIW